LLKTALDVAYAVLWAGLAAAAVLTAAGLLAAPFLAGGAHTALRPPGAGQGLSPIFDRLPALIALGVAVAVYLGVLLVIFYRLRQVFATLIIGDPFQPENVGRLRTVGLALIALEAVGYVVRLAVTFVAPARADGHVFGVNLSGWFAILVVFVLAEVFREGARLRRDAELTI